MPFPRKKYGKVGRQVMKVGNTAYGVASKALSIANQVKKLVNAEYKYVDTSGSGNVSSTGTIDCLSLIAQGTTATTRTGNTVKYARLSLKMLQAANVTTDNNFGVSRYIIFRDLQSDGTAPTVAEVLESASVNAFLNNNNKARFTVLKDFYLKTSSKTSNTNNVFKCSIPLSHHGYYKSSGGTIAEVQNDNLFILFINWGNTNPPNYAYTARLRFLDN